MTFFQRRRPIIRRAQRFVGTTILGGLVVVLPLTLFVFIIKVLFDLIIGVIQPLSSLLGFSDHVNEWLINLLVLAIILVLFFLIGLAVRTEIGQRLFQSIEDQWLKPLPFYTILRETVQQLFSKDKMPFSKVALVDPFGSGTLMTGFITDELPNGFFTVFVPTAPNPTNGFIFHIPPDRITLVDTGTEDALRSVISLGIGSNKLFRAEVGAASPSALQNPASEG
jgi:uncharacterized membrane protein